jgi:hypothetical protein
MSATKRTSNWPRPIPAKPLNETVRRYGLLLYGCDGFAVMERLHIREALSLDSDFAQFGFTLVD